MLINDTLGQCRSQDFLPGWAKENPEGGGGAASALDSVLIRLEVFSEGSNPPGGGEDSQAMPLLWGKL